MLETLLLDLDDDEVACSMELSLDEFNDINSDRRRITKEIEQRLEDYFLLNYEAEELLHYFYINRNGLHDDKDLVLLLRNLNVDWDQLMVKEIELISQYDSSLSHDSTVLFHNLRHDFINIGRYIEVVAKFSLVFLGVTFLEDKIYFVIKAFDDKVFLSFYDNLLENLTDISPVKCMHNPAFTILKNLGKDKRETEFQESEMCQKLLDQTLRKANEEVFSFIFSKLDSQGYLEMDDFEKQIGKRKRTIIDVKQLYGFFDCYLKYETRDRRIYLHNQLPENLKDSIKNQVFSFSPHLFKYYQLYWFEDFLDKIIESIHQDNDINYKIVDKMCNWEVDFGTEKKYEFDLLLEVSDGIKEKIIGIECKKKISSSNHKKTKDNIKKKILQSPYFNLVDVYILAGYFISQSFKRCFKQGIFIDDIEQVNLIKPFYGFYGNTSEELKNRLVSILDDIFT